VQGHRVVATEQSSSYTEADSTPEEDTVQAKEAVRELLNRLPDDCSVEDVLYHLYVLQSVERGQADVAAGRTIPHEEVDRALRRKWLRDSAG
jgi:predicted transcriptional regulator